MLLLDNRKRKKVQTVMCRGLSAVVWPAAFGLDGVHAWSVNDEKLERPSASLERGCSLANETPSDHSSAPVHKPPIISLQI